MLDDPSSIVALNLTARKVYLVWKSQAPTISEAVLSRTIRCYINAVELFEAQDSTLPSKIKDAYNTVLTRNKALVLNASVVTRAERLLIKSLELDERGCHTSALGLNVRTHEFPSNVENEVPFASVYYRLWHIAVVSPNAEAKGAFMARFEDWEVWCLDMALLDLEHKLDCQAQVDLGMMPCEGTVSPPLRRGAHLKYYGCRGWQYVASSLMAEKRGRLSSDPMRSRQENLYVLGNGV